MSSLACIKWIRDEVETHGDLQDLNPPLVDTKSLCEFVSDGRALCLLTSAVLDGEENELPKKLQRSLRQLSKFHALERVQFFIKWCRTRAKLEEHQVFTTVQLLDEVNEIAVSETIVALRNKTRPGLKATTSLSQYYGDGDTPRASSTTSASRTTSSHANRLSSFLTKFPSAPVVATKAIKPPATRVSLTSSVSSKNSSPREGEEPVLDDDGHAMSRLRIPSIFKSTTLTSGTPRSSVISNASSTASFSKDDSPTIRSRSWSNKLSVFSRSLSSSNASALQSSPTAHEVESNHTPPSSPPASPLNRMSIPSAFTTPVQPISKSRSKLSAFLSSVETTPATPASSAPSQEDKGIKVALDGEVAGVDNQQEESNGCSGAEDTEDEAETQHESDLKKGALLQKSEPVSCEAEAPEEEDDFGAVNATEKAAEAVTNECRSGQDKEIKSLEPVTLSSVDEVEAGETLTKKAAWKAKDNAVKERAEAELEVETNVETGTVSVPPVQENDRLAMENEALMQKLQTTEASVALKDILVAKLNEDIARLTAQLGQEQIAAQDARVAATKQERLAAKAAALHAQVVSCRDATATQELEEANGQVHELTVRNERLQAELTSLRAEFRTLEQSVQLARDSEEAARYAAQVAFAARDSADERMQHLKLQLEK